MNKRKRQRIFETWLREHKGLLFKVVRAYAFTPADQEDLFQDMVLQLWQSLPNFRNKAAASTWIYRVALYTALAWTRKERKHQTQKEDFDETLHTLTPTNTDPRLDWLYEQIAQLSPVDRSLMLLMLEGFTYKEMAHLIGISESHVGVKLNRIKKRLALQSREEELNHGF